MSRWTSLLAAGLWLSAMSARAAPPAAPVRAHPAVVAPVAHRVAGARAPEHAGGAAARARVDLGATDITGNKELPKIMYVVPWRHAPADGQVLAPPDSVMDQVLTPVDREVFRRRVRYFRELHAASPGPHAQLAPDGDKH